MILKDRTPPSDSERMALFYIIGGNEELFMKRQPIYDFKNHEINPEVLSSGEVDLCSGSKELVSLLIIFLMVMRMIIRRQEICFII